jgi:hypothetical protein
MILLPKIPMRKREFDARVGYFSNKYDILKRSLKIRNQSLCSKMAFRESAEDA